MIYAYYSQFLLPSLQTEKKKKPRTMCLRLTKGKKLILTLLLLSPFPNNKTQARVFATSLAYIDQGLLQHFVISSQPYRKIILRILSSVQYQLYMGLVYNSIAANTS